MTEQEPHTHSLSSRISPSSSDCLLSTDVEVEGWVEINIFWSEKRTTCLSSRISPSSSGCLLCTDVEVEGWVEINIFWTEYHTNKSCFKLFCVVGRVMAIK
jgi:hypothetical protein